MVEWLRIGDLVQRTGVTHRTLRHYDELGLLSPSGRSSGDYRLYSAEDLRRLLAIQHLKSLGLGLAEVARALDDSDFDARAELARHIETVQARLEAERQLLERLRRLQDAADAGWDEVLGAIALTERLRHPDASVRFRATLDAPDAAPLPELIDMLLDDPEPGVREVATWAVVRHGAEAVDVILPHLADPDPGVRLQMAHVLGKLADPAAVPGIAELLDDPDEAVAAKAAFALGRIAILDASAVPALLAAVGSPRPLLHDAVSGALERALEAEPSLVGFLASPDADIRAHAAEILGYREARAATSHLASLLADPEPDVRLAAILALGQLGNDEAGRAIAGAVTSDDERVRLVAQRLVVLR